MPEHAAIRPPQGTYDAPVIIPLRNILAMQGSERVMQEVQRAMHALHGAGYTIEHIEDALLKKPYQIIVDPCSVKEGLWVDTTNPPFLVRGGQRGGWCGVPCVRDLTACLCCRPRRWSNRPRSPSLRRLPKE